MDPGLAPSPELVWFTGSDAVRFLDDLLSQEIADVEPASVTRSLLLSPQGKMQFILWVLRGEQRVGLATEDGRGQELVDTLSRYRIRVDVTIEPESEPVYLIVGEKPSTEAGWKVAEGIMNVDLSWESVPRTLLVGGPPPELPRLTQAEYDALRIAAGEPLMSVDVDEGTIPQETPLVPETISFDKGCFLGQELVARLDSRGGRVNHHLRILEFDSPVPVGARLSAGEREVGEVTTASGSRGLALVWREVGPGDRVFAGSVTGTVSEIPQKTERDFTGS